jgi:uncharacterized protein YndB with AHSA1/START domain
MTSPIKQDAKGRRAIALEFEVPGTPEQVWQAIATGPGITSWFATSEVEEREGGAVAFHMGGGIESSGRVTVWDPPARFAYEEPEWLPPAPPLATEFIIEARSGGTCVVRIVHSLFASSDDWDDQLSSFETGWASLFNVLRLYLTHFFGQRCVNVRVMSPSPSSEAQTWSTLIRTLGLGGAAKGTRGILSAPGAPALAGTIERFAEGSHLYETLLRLDEPVPGIALIGAYTWGGTTHATTTLFLYGERAAAIAPLLEESWRRRMIRVLPANAASEVSQATP